MTPLNNYFLYGLSEKKDGQMKIRPNENTGIYNRSKFFNNLGLAIEKMVWMYMLHGDTILVADEKYLGKQLPDCDGLLTKIPGLILTATAADCLPVYFFDTENKITGIAHAGWRGISNNIVSKMVTKMKSEFNSLPNQIVVKVGPHIKSCHFEVKGDVLSKFKDYEHSIIDKGNNQVSLDLGSIVRDQLMKEGVLSENIDISEECTHCLVDKYYSYRRDKPEKLEAMMAYSVIKGSYSD